MLFIDAQPDRGFHWSYYLFVPSNAVNNSGTHMLVEPNNTGKTSDQMDIHFKRAKALVEQGDPRKIAEGLNTPLLVPVFPRPQNKPYIHFLSRDTLLINDEKLRRVDLQLLAMIDHAHELLRENGIKVADKVFMHGFSASGNYLTRFTMIHPERVRAVAAGGLSGMPTLPVKHWDRWNYLRYPIGVADLYEIAGTNFDLEAFKKVSQYWYMGYLDTNDTLPYPECYAPEDAAMLREMLGNKIMDRWQKSKEIFEYAGVPAQFVTYNGTEHAIRSEMIQDIIKFFQANVNDGIVHIEPHQYTYVPNEKLTEVTIIAATWYDNSDYPAGMKKSNSSNSFAIFTKEWIYSQNYTQMSKFVRENLPQEGWAIYLADPYGTMIKARATGSTFSKDPQGFIFEIDPLDMSKIQPGIQYKLQPVKASDTYYFTVQDGVTLTRK